MSLPLVSVIIPVYNAQKCLSACLDSVLNQNYTNTEVILVNDGSKDNSLLLCQQYAARDARVMVIDQANGGPGAARNAALSIATGDYLHFIDSDDVVPQGAIQAMVTAMEGQDLVIAHFQICTPQSASRRGLIKQERQMDRAAFLEALIIWPGAYYYSAMWNKLYRRSVVEEHNIRFDTTVIWGEDCLFNMTYDRFVQRVRCIPVVVYHYYRKVSGLSWGSVFQLHKGIRIKNKIYQALKLIYVEAGLYKKHYWRVQRYILNVTLMD